jgi:chemotaxis protein MotB
MRPVYFYFVILSFSVLSCVSAGKFKAVQQAAKKHDSLYTWSQRTLKTCQDANDDLNKQKSSLKNEANELNLELTASKENNTQLRKQLQSLSALSSAQAESIKKSMDNMGATDIYLRNLQSALKHRDSVNLVVIMDLKASLGSFGDQDVKIKIEKGVVNVDLSDTLLFSSDSNSYTVSGKAKAVLGRLARVLNDQPDIELMVEGHTDSISYPQDILLDNWDLSAKRATSLVRILQNDYNISPVRMTAAGRSEYITVSGNDIPEGRAANRRTRIVILPQLDQLLRLLERRRGQEAPPL